MFWCIFPPSKNPQVGKLRPIRQMWKWPRLIPGAPLSFVSNKRPFYFRNKMSLWPYSHVNWKKSQPKVEDQKCSQQSDHRIRFCRHILNLFKSHETNMWANLFPLFAVLKWILFKVRFEKFPEVKIPFFEIQSQSPKQFLQLHQSRKGLFSQSTKVVVRKIVIPVSRTIASFFVMRTLVKTRFVSDCHSHNCPWCTGETTKRRQIELWSPDGVSAFIGRQGFADLLNFWNSMGDWSQGMLATEDRDTVVMSELSYVYHCMVEACDELSLGRSSRNVNSLHHWNHKDPRLTSCAKREQPDVSIFSSQLAQAACKIMLVTRNFCPRICQKKPKKQQNILSFCVIFFPVFRMCGTPHDLWRNTQWNWSQLGINQLNIYSCKISLFQQTNGQKHKIQAGEVKVRVWIENNLNPLAKRRTPRFCK